jgi:hypothetical protein
MVVMFRTYARVSEDLAADSLTALGITLPDGSKLLQDISFNNGVKPREDRRCSRCRRDIVNDVWCCSLAYFRVELAANH